MGEYIQEYISIAIDMKRSWHIMTSSGTFNSMWITDNIIRSGYVKIICITLDLTSWYALKSTDEDMLWYHQVLVRILYYNQSLVFDMFEWKIIQFLLDETFHDRDGNKLSNFQVLSHTGTLHTIGLLNIDIQFLCNMESKAFACSLESMLCKVEHI
jgi:hypothetical protein